MKRHETGVPFVRDIDDSTLVLRCIEAMLEVWFDEATQVCEHGEETGFSLGIRLQLRSLLTDLHDRRKRLDGEINEDRHQARQSEAHKKEW